MRSGPPDVTRRFGFPLAVVLSLVPGGSSASAAAQTVTAEEAQSLSLPRLATRVLGTTAASNVIDVERPREQGMGGFPRPVPPSARRRLPPLGFLSFFTRAAPLAMPLPADTQLVMCRAQRIEVGFDDAGRVTAAIPIVTYGAVGRPGPSRGRREPCSALPTTRAFVQAADARIAMAAVVGVAGVHSAMLAGGARFLTSACVGPRFARRNCSSPAGLAALAPDVRVGTVTVAERVRCGGRPAPEVVCLNVEFRSAPFQSDSLQLRMRGIAIEQADFQRAEVVY